MNASLKKIIDRVEEFIDKPWYIPLIAFLTAADCFIWIVPIEPLLISKVLLRPKRWLYAALAVGSGSAIGALALSAAIHFNVHFLPAWMTTPSTGSMWGAAATYIERHGAFGVWLASITLVPLQPTVILGSLAGVPIHTIFLAVLLARIPKYLIFASIASFAPHWLQKIPWVRKSLRRPRPDGT